jgi:hypothetical protein
MLTNFTITSKLARLEERDTSRLSQVQPGWTSEVNSSPLEESHPLRPPGAGHGDVGDV